MSTAKLLPRFCDAKLPGLRPGRHTRCRRYATPGHYRCALHGSKATGPVTPEGLARTVAAMKAGRARWLAQLKASGLPVPFGRKKGGRNRSPEDRVQAAYEKRCDLEYRRIARQTRADRKARKEAVRQERKEAAELEQRHARSHDGLALYDDLGGQLEANFELTLAFFRDHGGGGRDLERDLARWERTLIEHLNSPHPRPHEALERSYNDLVRWQEVVGRATGDPAHLDRLHRAYDNYLKHRAAEETIKQVTMDRAVAVTERHTLPVAQPIGQTTGDQPMESEPGCPLHARKLQRAYEISNLIVEAGRAAGRRFAGERVEPERRLPIAPWLRR